MMEDMGVADDGNGNGYGGRITGLEFRYAELKQDVGELKAQLASGVAQIGADIRQTRERSDMRMEALGAGLAERARTNWPVILGVGIGVFGMITTLVGAGYYVTTQQTQLLATPLALRAEVLGSAQANLERRLAGLEAIGRETDKALQAGDSRETRGEQGLADIRQRLDRLADTVANNTNDLRGITEALKEVETQFRGDEQLAQMRDQYQQRWNGIFYQRLFGRDMPSLGATAPGLARGLPS